MEVVVTGVLQTLGHLILCIKSLDEEDTCVFINRITLAYMIILLLLIIEHVLIKQKSVRLED